VLKLKCLGECSKQQVRFEVDCFALAAVVALNLDGSRNGTKMGGSLVARALKNHNVWLTLGYVGIILLMARAYS
jgi:hypothetical protein